MKVVVVDNSGELYVMPDTVLLRNNDPYFLPDYAENGEEVVCGVCVKVTRIAKCIAERFAHRVWEEYTVAQDHRIVGVHHTIGRCFDRSFEVGVEWCSKSVGGVDRERVDRALALASEYIQLRIGDYVFVPNV